AGESLRQRLAREPGAPARERHRAHVGDGGDAGVLQQGHEAIGRQVGVADGQEVAGGGSRHWLGRILAVCPVLRAAARSDGAPVAIANIHGNRAVAFVVVLHLTLDAPALIIERGLEDASWRMPWVALPVGPGLRFYFRCCRGRVTPAPTSWSESTSRANACP